MVPIPNPGLTPPASAKRARSVRVGARIDRARRGVTRAPRSTMRTPIATTRGTAARLACAAMCPAQSSSAGLHAHAGVFVLAALFAGCRNEPAPRTSTPPEAPTAAAASATLEPPREDAPAPRWTHVATTNGGTYRVGWRSFPEPIPENEPFRLHVLIERADGSGPAPEGLALEAGAVMPAHRHGMLRQPRTTRLEDGSYEVEGMLLHMGGAWDLFFDLVHARTVERARFPIALVPPAATAALEGFDAESLAKILALSPLPPVPDDPTNAHDTSAAAAHLGRYLFFDPRLSASGEVSCATCHVPALDWTDGKPLADVGKPLERHTPSLWNVAYGRWFFWDGRADSLWAQALHPLEEAREHAFDRVSLARLFWEDAALRRAYTEVFGPPPALTDAARFPPRARPVPGAPDDPMALAWNAMSTPDRDAVARLFANVGKALAAFERSIVSGRAPFDDFVDGVQSGDLDRIGALSPEARRGLWLFVGKANCHFCHSGPNFTDREFHHNQAPTQRGLPLDLGRFRGLQTVMSDVFNGLGPFSDGQDQDTRDKLEKTPVDGGVWGEFKTPSLRNVARTAPYMHQGQFATLAEVIDFYSDRIPPPSLHDDRERVLVPLHLSAGEKADLLAFLESLSGPEAPAELRGPPSTPYVGP